MSKLPSTRSETTFVDAKRGYSPLQALTEAHRCLYCVDAPCVQACPTAIEIPEFIRKIATGNLRGSARTIFAANIFGMSCARVCPVEVLCVGSCVFNEMDAPPIEIGKLQRFATDAAFERGDRFFAAGPASGKRVALLGGGPASIAAAHELRRRGHACTIFEQGQLLGGLSTTGVAPYKMRADRATEEVDWVLGIGGVEVRLGVSVGRDISVQDLLQSYDAIFVGLGLGADRLLQLPGADLQGVRGAVDWIAAFKTGTISLQGVKSAVVIGGGNTAVDAVRELHGLGVPEVTMAYRGDETRMSGYEHEWRVAKVAGVRGLWNVQPLAYEGDGGRVGAVRFAKLDDQRQPIAEREPVVAADLVLLAIGQGRLGALLGDIEGISLDRGRLLVDAEGRTQNPKIFAGGDCANGGKEVVNAVAEGKRAAIAIDRDLCGGEAS